MTDLLDHHHDDLPTLLAHAAPTPELRARWPQALADMVDLVVAVQRRRGRSHDEALGDAEACALAIGQYHGGRQWYLPSGERLRTAARDRIIWLDYKGRQDLPALMRRWRIGERRLEQILAEQKALDGSQGKLFG